MKTILAYIRAAWIMANEPIKFSSEKRTRGGLEVFAIQASVWDEYGRGVSPYIIMTILNFDIEIRKKITTSWGMNFADSMPYPWSMITKNSPFIVFTIELVTGLSILFEIKLWDRKVVWE